MSHAAVQRVIVRMLYDPAFVARGYAEPTKATADCDLEESEREWLVGPDRRAYLVDPLRRSRSLTGLLEEFPVAAARRIRAQEDSSALDPFFSSGLFHVGMQDGESLAGLFGRWLERGLRDGPADESSRACAELEGAMASGRRQPLSALDPQPARGEWVLAPGVLPLELPGRTLASYSAQLETLRSHPRGLLEAVVDLGWPLPELPVDSREREGVLIDARAEDLRLEPMSPELCGVLRLLAAPRSFESLVEAAAAFGADGEDCQGIVEGFAEDGLLLRG
jgi:hypothetical protein